ncbi:MAG TPA: metal-dependent transcriptional regulator [Bacteriovoracaceae bacterium]|nr:metal-dependent transcriptional regulator [Bacteriovoracaceae bacterium]
MSDKKIAVSHTHDNDLTHSMVHYLLAIHKLKESKGYARVTDIAIEMGLTKGSVSTALTNLKKRELVMEDESKFLSLSATGHDAVHGILSSRTLLFYFLKDIIGVNEEVAHKDSCLMEHLMSSDTRERFFNFMKSLCSEDIKRMNFSTSFDFSQFEHQHDFEEIQKGDTYLKS